MRNLTITRTKSFVACLARVQVYIEDPAAAELTINDVPCRKLGVLKNGETKTFEVGEGEAKVFVIADKLSRNFCSEYYRLPEGQEDVFLSGKNRYNPANGNAFRFDGNEGTEVSEHRKKGTRRGIVILVIAAIVGFALGFGYNYLADRSAEAKTFTAGGMTITLTDEFSEKDIEQYEVAFESRKVAVWALTEKFSLVEGWESYTVEQYLEMVLEANDLTGSQIVSENGLCRFEYSSTIDGDSYHYVSYGYKAEDAFWLVQFVTLEKDAEKYAPKLAEWAASVKFTAE